MWGVVGSYFMRYHLLLSARPALSRFTAGYLTLPARLAAPTLMNGRAIGWRFPSHIVGL